MIWSEVMRGLKRLHMWQKWKLSCYWSQSIKLSQELVVWITCTPSWFILRVHNWTQVIYQLHLKKRNDSKWSEMYILRLKFLAYVQQNINVISTFGILKKIIYILYKKYHRLFFNIRDSTVNCQVESTVMEHFQAPFFELQSTFIFHKQTEIFL